jgi:phosphate transport system protein
MRSRFDEQLVLLNKELITMGSMCEEAISYDLKALSGSDKELAGKVAPLNIEIDHMERDIETLCMKMLLQQQPVASDLRQISAALKMVTDLERIGDQAGDIAEIIPFLDGRSTILEHIQIHEMAEATMKMVTESVDAYVKKNMSLAEEVIAYDDVVDECFTKVKKNLTCDIAGNPDDGELALDLLMIAKYFERIGDHAVNVAEWVIFSITGNKK